MLSREYGNEETRLRGWNLCIERFLWSVVPETTAFMLGLAVFDCGLIRKDRTLVPKVKDPPSHGVNSAERIEYMTLSILWVFGAYEVVRTLHQRLRKHSDAAVPRSELCFRIGELKKAFERVRVPLAKFEKPNRSPADTGVAIHGFDFEKGATWFVTSTKHVTRRELSDSLLETLQDWKALIEKEHTP